MALDTMDKLVAALAAAQRKQFIKTTVALENPGVWSSLWAAVRAHDWRTIARLYNGSGNVDTYAGLLERKYNELAAG